MCVSKAAVRGRRPLLLYQHPPDGATLFLPGGGKPRFPFSVIPYIRSLRYSIGWMVGGRLVDGGWPMGGWRVDRRVGRRKESGKKYCAQQEKRMVKGRVASKRETRGRCAGRRRSTRAAHPAQKGRRRACGPWRHPEHSTEGLCAQTGADNASGAMCRPCVAGTSAVCRGKARRFCA